MVPPSQLAKKESSLFDNWLKGTLVFLALLVIARFIAEVLGMSHHATRLLSSSAAIYLAALYLGSVAPLRGVSKHVQLILPAIVLAAWVEAWIIIFTIISALLQLPRSHFAEIQDYGNMSHLGRHVLAHLFEIIPVSILVLVLMAVLFFLRHWPVTVGPAALLGGLVIIRFWVEAMGTSPAGAAAWSSTVGILASGFYLGGVGPRLGLERSVQLVGPALALGWVWRFWVFLAAVMSAASPYYHTHFFDPSRGRIGVRLIAFFGSEVLLVGFIAGLIVWGIASWTAWAFRPSGEA